MAEGLGGSHREPSEDFQGEENTLRLKFEKGRTGCRDGGPVRRTAQEPRDHGLYLQCWRGDGERRSGSVCSEGRVGKISWQMECGV